MRLISHIFRWSLQADDDSDKENGPDSSATSLSILIQTDKDGETNNLSLFRYLIFKENHQAIILHS